MMRRPNTPLCLLASTAGPMTAAATHSFAAGLGVMAALTGLALVFGKPID